MKFLIFFVFALVASTAALRCYPEDQKPNYCDKKEHLVYDKCSADTICQPTCTRESYWPCHKACKDGCVCEEGYVRDYDWNCIKKKNCEPYEADNCFLPLETGPCKMSLERYGYDPTQGTCRDFVYGGCAGNSNRFMTLEQCKSACNNITVCDASQHLTYSNCYAVEECQPTCTRDNYFPCVKICKPGCVCEEGYVRDENWNCIKKKECVTNEICDEEKNLEYSECYGDTICQPTCYRESYYPCHKQCISGCVCKEGYVRNRAWNCVPSDSCDPIDTQSFICTAPISSGPCEAHMPVWGYETESASCVEFSYGGCEGNENRFRTKEMCETVCADVKIDPGTCLLPREVGHCKGAFTRWGYDSETGKCVEFSYGGCGGNANRYISEELCNAACHHVPVDPAICFLPQESGPCYGNFDSWGYNASIGVCDHFVYGGCDGNGNRFATEERCDEACSEVPVTPEICALPIVRGPCRGSLPRWGYDPETGCCQAFTYGGCQGNGNRFLSEEACNSACA